jgi:hypothetical protein
VSRSGDRRHRSAFPEGKADRWRLVHLVARNGGADRVRTGDLRLARAALSQLSYSPVPKTGAAVQPRASMGAAEQPRYQDEGR